jgi:hypothetical protein
VLLLFAWTELAYAEIADALGVSGDRLLPGEQDVLLEGAEYVDARSAVGRVHQRPGLPPVGATPGRSMV